MRITLILSLCSLLAISSFAQSQVIKEIDYSYEKVGNLSMKSVHKDVFVFGNNKNKVEVLDLKKDSGQSDFDTTGKTIITYDTATNQVTQVSMTKKSPGVWKKQSEVVTVYNKDKSTSEIDWSVWNSKDKMAAYRKFVYTNDTAKRPSEIEYMDADSTGKFKPDSKLVYDYDRKGLKTCSFMTMQPGNKWIKLSMYVVMFDSSNIIGAMMKFKNGNRLDNRYYVENSYNESTSTRTLAFKNYHPETTEYGGKPQSDSYITAYYKNEMVTGLMGYTRDIKAGKWIKEVTVKYTYGDAGHPLNKVLQNYLKYNPLATSFNNYVNEDVTSDVNGIIDGSKFFAKGQNKSIILGMDGAMMKFLDQ